jgi:hypothetical protein
MKVWVKCLVNRDDNSDILAIAVDEECADRVIVEEAAGREEVDPIEDETKVFYDLVDEKRYADAYEMLLKHTGFEVTTSGPWEVADHKVEEKLDAATGG